MSYVHAGWFKAFQHLGYDTYWFDDYNFPQEFDWKNCIFISEEYGAKNIPLEKSSVYFIHDCINPSKYLGIDARLIDIRFNVNEINDCNYSMKMDRTKLVKIDEVSFYDPKANDDVLAFQWRRGIQNYEALYISWATDLLPHEFNYDDRYRTRDETYYHIGTICESNIKEIRKVAQALLELNVQMGHVDPWVRPISFEQNRELVQRSKLSLDVRGTVIKPDINGMPNTGGNHKHIGYIPCRTFKSISYGRFSGTNSKAVKALFGDFVVYNDDEYQLVFDMNETEKKQNYDILLEAMKFVQNNHTYLNRVNSIMKVYDQCL